MDNQHNYFTGLLKRLDTKSECTSIPLAKLTLDISHFTAITLFQGFAHRLDSEEQINPDD
jgi:hypothetical protein